MFRIVRVNMSDLSVKAEEIAKEYEGLGGRGLTSAIVAKEVPHTCSPIGPNNKNEKAGFTPADDRLPEFFKIEKLPPHNQVFDVPDEELDRVFNF